MDPEHPDSPPDERDESKEVHQRIVLPLVVPAVVFLFALLVIYGLSRIFLEISEVEIGAINLAVPLAIGVSLAILFTAWYITSRPRVPQWQIASFSLVAVALLTGGAIFAAVHDEGEGGETVVGEATPTPPDGDGPTPPDGVGVLVMMGDNFFELLGDRTPEIVVQAGQEVTLNILNNGRAVHNMHIDGTDDNFDVDFCEVGEGQPCSDPDVMTAGATGTITFQFDQPGTYLFRCDFHPVEMVGTIRAE